MPGRAQVVGVEPDQAAVVDEHPAAAVGAVQLAGQAAVADRHDARGDVRGARVVRGEQDGRVLLRARARASSSRIARPVAASSWPVTSSTSRSLGRTAIATHSAARCCSPPESSARRAFSRPSRPTRSSSSLARACACRAADAGEPRPERDPRADRLVVAERLARVLRDGGDGAARGARRAARGFASSSRVPYTYSSPAVTGCSPARQASSVDFPEPLGPITATSSPGLGLQRRALQRHDVPGRRLVDDEQLAGVDRELSHGASRARRRGTRGGPGCVAASTAARRGEQRRGGRQRPRERGQQLGQRAAAVGAEREQVGEAGRSARRRRAGRRRGRRRRWRRRPRPSGRAACAAGRRSPRARPARRRGRGPRRRRRGRRRRARRARRGRRGRAGRRSRRGRAGRRRPPRATAARRSSRPAVGRRGADPPALGDRRQPRELRVERRVQAADVGDHGLARGRGRHVRDRARRSAGGSGRRRARARTGSRSCTVRPAPGVASTGTARAPRAAAGGWRGSRRRPRSSTRRRAAAAVEAAVGRGHPVREVGQAACGPVGERARQRAGLDRRRGSLVPLPPLPRP